MSLLLPRHTHCPHCGLDLDGGLIADTMGADDAEKYYGSREAHWQKEIGVEIPMVYDGTAYWQCPDCDGTWHRWSPESGMQERIAEHMK